MRLQLRCQQRLQSSEDFTRTEGSASRFTHMPQWLSRWGPLYISVGPCPERVIHEREQASSRSMQRLSWLDSDTDHHVHSILLLSRPTPRKCGWGLPRAWMPGILGLSGVVLEAGTWFTWYCLSVLTGQSLPLSLQYQWDPGRSDWVIGQTRITGPPPLRQVWLWGGGVRPIPASEREVLLSERVRRKMYQADRNCEFRNMISSCPVIECFYNY